MNELIIPEPKRDVSTEKIPFEMNKCVSKRMNVDLALTMAIFQILFSVLRDKDQS